MNVRTLLLWGILGLLLFQPACQNPTEPETTVTPLATHVTGTVLRNDNLSPVTNAVVYDFAALARDTSKSDGSFKLTYELLSQTKTSIVATRSGFGNDTASVVLNPGVDTSIVLRLKADSLSPAGTTSSRGAGSVFLVSVSSDNISIRGTGANESALLVFEVRDSVGVPIGGANKMTLNFTILGGPAGEEYIFPVSGETDVLTGRVTTRVNAGKKAGVLQVVASGTVPGTSKVIKSSPVKITISGGLPVKERFSLSRLPMNIAGGVYDNLRATIQVIVGDKEGNPVQQGTAVSFTTNGGIIQPNAVTSKDGIANVELISGNPRPANSVAIVTAKTIGDSGAVIKDSIAVLFSGPTRVITPSTTVVVPDSGTATFEYRVQDPNGFPLVSGTQISLSVEGVGASELELFGDVSKTLNDSNDPSTTLFKATVRDKKLKGANGDVTFKVTVTSTNGNLTKTFPGYVLADTNAAPPVFTPSTSGYASSLTLVGIPSPELSISGTGQTETTKLTFIAKDSVGNPVEIRKRAYVTFSILPVGGTGGGEFLFPTADSTDASGTVSTTFNAGTRSGVLQVVAQANVFGRIIRSSPIRLTIFGGLPDPAHFTASLSPINMPGWAESPGKVGTVSVQVGDKFGNPVQPGTALYFTTTGGLIQASARTDNDGFAQVDLLGGNPFPSDSGFAGLGHVTVQTVGEGGASVQKLLPFMFSGAPRIALLNVPTDTVRIYDGASYDVEYLAADLNGNPLSKGSTIAVSASGQGANGVTLSGDIGVQIPDTQDKNNFTRYRFRVADNTANGGASGDLVFSISVSGPTGSYVRKFYGVLYPPQIATTVPPSARVPSQIAFLGITNGDIYVAGVGNTENTVITYEVRDSLGVAIDKSRRVGAAYTMQFFPNSIRGGGTQPTIIPAADSTDDSGRLRVSIASGTEAGVIQLVARIQLANGMAITSQPVKVTVHAGFPDQAHFTLIPSRYVFPGFDSFNTVGFQVVVGDTFSNPVQQGTALYFHSQAGVMLTGTTSGATYTNATGIASASLYTVNPRPGAVPYYDPNAGSGRLGYHWIYVQTQGKGGRKIIDSALVVWNKAPIIATLTLPGGAPLPRPVPIPQGGTTVDPITLTVTDANGNPLCDGTTITTSITYTTDVAGVAFGVSGQISSRQAFVMPNAGYIRYPGGQVTEFTFNVSDLSTGGGAGVGQTLLVQIVIDAPGLQQLPLSFYCKIQ